MERVRFMKLGVCFLVAMTAGCGGGGGGSSGRAAAPPAPSTESFSYSIQGSAIKGVISGATISVIDGDGVFVSGASTSSGAGGFYTIEFSTATQVIEPVQISLSGTGATAVCDVSPTCEYGVDAEGNTLAVSFGETYSLPDDFNLRATITSLTANGNNRSGTAFISPLSDFVTELALDMGSGQDLTAANLDVTPARAGWGQHR